MEIITYSLLDKINSDAFYKTLTLCTDEVIYSTTIRLKDIIHDYCIYQYKDKITANLDEIVFELLIIAVLSKVYAPKIKELNRVQYSMLRKISDLRRKSELIKPLITYIKGYLTGRYLYSSKALGHEVVENLIDFNKLIIWLDATGEFKEEVTRLKKWHGFFSILNDKEALKAFNDILEYGIWFEKYSEKKLGKFTLNVNAYLRSDAGSTRFNEDHIFTRRKRVEYHLNMVGSEIMNRIFREDFLNTTNKVLLLPICMTSPEKNKCMSKLIGNDFKCEDCSKECQVNYLSKLGEDLDFTVKVFPHESSISTLKRDQLFSCDMGAVGVACVLNLISGGGLLKEMNIPAQCVILDYCGCKNHWHNEGIVTSINIERLKEIIYKKEKVN